MCGIEEQLYIGGGLEIDLWGQGRGWRWRREREKERGGERRGEEGRGGEGRGGRREILLGIGRGVRE